MIKLALAVIIILVCTITLPKIIDINNKTATGGNKPGSQNTERQMDIKKYNRLTEEEKRVIVDKGTELAFTGEYTDNFAKGVYICRRCNAMLYRSEDKFHSGCGWPAFDDEIPGAIKRQPDADGRRTEIICANCGGHLGHVFTGEHLTDKNIRHCVNSISMKFVPEKDIKFGRAIVAGGCFWGVEYHLQKLPGVISTTVGYIGGDVESPTYEQVCAKGTGHAEAVEVIFDPAVTNYETVLKRFFEIHDPSQINRQGPDIGDQYRSAVFYSSEAEKEIVDRLIEKLKAQGIDVATKLEKANKFWPAENYQQDYYMNKGTLPYCHIPVKRKWE